MGTQMGEDYAKKVEPQRERDRERERGRPVPEAYPALNTPDYRYGTASYTSVRDFAYPVQEALHYSHPLASGLPALLEHIDGGDSATTETDSDTHRVENASMAKTWFNWSAELVDHDAESDTESEGSTCSTEADSECTRTKNNAIMAEQWAADHDAESDNESDGSTCSTEADSECTKQKNNEFMAEQWPKRTSPHADHQSSDANKSYTAVRDFAYPATNPLHYCPPMASGQPAAHEDNAEDSDYSGSTTEPASEDEMGGNDGLVGSWPSVNIFRREDPDADSDHIGDSDHLMSTTEETSVAGENDTAGSDGSGSTTEPASVYQMGEDDGLVGSWSSVSMFRPEDNLAVAEEDYGEDSNNSGKAIESASVCQTGENNRLMGPWSSINMFRSGNNASMCDNPGENDAKDREDSGSTTEAASEYLMGENDGLAGAWSAVNMFRPSDNVDLWGNPAVAGEDNSGDSGDSANTPESDSEYQMRGNDGVVGSWSGASKLAREITYPTSKNQRLLNKCPGTGRPGENLTWNVLADGGLATLTAPEGGAPHSKGETDPVSPPSGPEIAAAGEGGRKNRKAEKATRSARTNAWVNKNLRSRSGILTVANNGRVGKSGRIPSGKRCSKGETVATGANTVSRFASTSLQLPAKFRY